MSKDIWHTADDAPKDFCDVVLANFKTGSCCVFLSPFHNVSFDYDKWCYLTDLIACEQELERTRKALDVAKERLKNTILDAEVLATPEYLASRAKETLDEITALEQKDVK